MWQTVFGHKQQKQLTNLRLAINKFFAFRMHLAFEVCFSIFLFGDLLVIIFVLFS